MRCPRKLHQKNIKQESSIKTKENEPNPFKNPSFKFFGSTFLERKVEKYKTQAYLQNLNEYRSASRIVILKRMGLAQRAERGAGNSQGRAVVLPKILPES